MYVHMRVRMYAFAIDIHACMAEAGMHGVCVYVYTHTIPAVDGVCACVRACASLCARIQVFCSQQVAAVRVRVDEILHGIWAS